MDMQQSHSRRMMVPGGSSKMVWFFGFLFLGLAGFSIVRHIFDAMTYSYLFLGLLAFVVACCLQNIEIRIAAIELYLQAAKKQVE
jgi:hypothetical protein